MNRNKITETPVLSVAQMRQADADTIANGTPSVELMRRAAQGIFDAYDGWK
jgi:NAD(P)H-hydrate repair Nnr-like enzyme with NAD(P)H-hydrate epimerase domain